MSIWSYIFCLGVQAGDGGPKLWNQFEIRLLYIYGKGEENLIVIIVSTLEPFERQKRAQIGGNGQSLAREYI